MMTRAQFEGEKNYRVSLSITKGMLQRGLITEKEFRRMDELLKGKYSPIIGSL